MRFKDLTCPEYKRFCDPSVHVPLMVSGSAVAVQRDNCTFSEKARIAQDHGIHAVIVVSEKLVSEFLCFLSVVIFIVLGLFLEVKFFLSHMGSWALIYYCSRPLPFPCEGVVQIGKVLFLMCIFSLVILLPVAV